jgi:tetratricopeptide (TPR) repeat protein
MQGALAGAREVGHYDYGKGLCLRGLGRIYTALERFDEAVDCLQQALATHREIGDRYATAWDLYDLGFTLRGAQGMDAARVPWQEALKIFTELGAVQADEVRGRLGGEDATNPGGQEERS